MPTWLIALDIDETQIPERTNPHYFDGENDSIQALKTSLETIRKDGKGIVVHVTNGMLHLYQAVADTLATSDYVTCNASTCIYKRTGNDLVPDPDFQAALQTCLYDPILAEKNAAQFPALTPSSPEHQTEYKRSFQMLDINLSFDERQNIFNELADLYKDEPGTAVFYVEGKMDENGKTDPQGPFPTIDILPFLCTKGECLKFIAAKEGIAPDRVLVCGNGDNDISMFRNEFHSVAVGNAQKKLMDHAAGLSRTNPAHHYIAQGTRSHAVLEGLRHFGIIPRPV